MIKQVTKSFVLFGIFGVIYCGIEIAARGYTHPAMFAVGGICGIIVGLINEKLDFDMSLIKQMLIGCICITAIEFISGIVLNIGLGLDIWDYSNKPFNYMGQVCLENSVYWFFLSGAAIILDDWLRYLLFGEEKPHYTIFGRF